METTHRVHEVRDDFFRGLIGNPIDEIKLRRIAVVLHNWHCHDAECTWNYEDWHVDEDGLPGQKQKYYDKAQKLGTFFDTREEVDKVIRFLKQINPKLAMKMIEEL